MEHVEVLTTADGVYSDNYVKKIHNFTQVVTFCGNYNINLQVALGEIIFVHHLC